MRAWVPWLGVALVLLTTPIQAQKFSGLDDKALPGATRYERCLALAKRDPRDTVSLAEAWHASGGSGGALHCAAMALVGLRRYADAAEKLDEAARDATAGGAELRAELYDQAGNAWLLAAEPQKAETSLSAGLALAPGDSEIRFDRARARAAHKVWAGADSDLSVLLAADPDRADVLVLRASARHALSRFAEARSDIDRALRIYPFYPEALVERGAMKAEAGDVAGARVDWERVLRDAPNSDAGAAARARLAQLAASAPPGVR